MFQMLTNQQAQFEKKYGDYLLSQMVKPDNLPIFFEKDGRGNYLSLQVASAWWGWCNNPDLERLRTACEKEFASVEELSNEVQRLRRALAGDTPTGFPEKLASLRAARGLTQRDLGALSGLAWSMISKYESGQCLPRKRSLMALERALDCPGELIGK